MAKTKWGYGRFFDASGRNVHTTRGVPCEAGLLAKRWPALLRFDGKLFADSRRFEDEFRVYREVPELIAQGE